MTRLILAGCVSVTNVGKSILTWREERANGGFFMQTCSESERCSDLFLLFESMDVVFLLFFFFFWSTSTTKRLQSICHSRRDRSALIIAVWYDGNDDAWNCSESCYPFACGPRAEQVEHWCSLLRRYRSPIVGRVDFVSASWQESSWSSASYAKASSRRDRERRSAREWRRSIHLDALRENLVISQHRVDSVGKFFIIEHRIGPLCRRFESIPGQLEYRRSRIWSE